MNQHFQKNAMKQQAQNRASSKMREINQEDEMEPDKICPMLAQAFIIAWFKKTTCSASGMEVNNNSLRKLMPKCLKEDCEIWVKEVHIHNEELHQDSPGRCGLINEEVVIE